LVATKFTNIQRKEQDKKNEAVTTTATPTPRISQQIQSEKIMYTEIKYGIGDATTELNDAREANESRPET
jgi:hypothetical protein